MLTFKKVEDPTGRLPIAYVARHIDTLTDEITDSVNAGNGYPWDLDRNQLSSMEEAEALAAATIDSFGAQGLYMAVDSGPSVSPRFDVILKWKLGEAVSREFNGDAYSCGKIIAISENGTVVTTSEDGGFQFSRKFKRVGLTGIWRETKSAMRGSPSPFMLVRGTFDERNREL